MLRVRSRHHREQGTSSVWSFSQLLFQNLLRLWKQVLQVKRALRRGKTLKISVRSDASRFASCKISSSPKEKLLHGQYFCGWLEVWQAEVDRATSMDDFGPWNLRQSIQRLRKEWSGSFLANSGGKIEMLSGTQNNVPELVTI